MRSLSRREKMSQPRSPRWVCSTTVGISAVAISAGYLVIVASGADSQATSAARENRQAPPELAARQLASLGQLDDDRLLDLQELPGLLGVHHLGRRS